MAIASKPPSDGRAVRARIWRRVLLWVGAAAAVTTLLWIVRDRLDKAQMALAFLLVVLAGSSRDGRIVGLVLSVVCFLAFNFFLLPPFYTFQLAQGLDWWVLIAFLITGGVSAQLLHRQQVAAADAERRALEIDRLAALGAESLSVPHAADAMVAIERVIRSELPVESAAIRLIGARDAADSAHAGGADATRAAGDLETYAATERRIVALTREGTTHLEAAGARLATMLPRAADFTDVLVPLSVRERTLGVLRLSDSGGLRFEAGQARFADALAYYAALAADRARLSAEAERVEALREADRLKDALLASVSHDLRTPLTSIRAAASELRSEGEERGALIEEEADRLNRLVADLLDLSRLRAGALPLAIEVNAAEDLIGASLQRLSGVPGAADIRVHLPPGELLALGRFDFVHTLRALTNLLENALKHSPAPGSVELVVRIDDDQLVLDVMDRGPGVPESERVLLFEPFFRSASAAGTQGTGLGLAITSRIAQAQGGSTTFQARAGGGSIFSLRFPAASLESTS